MSRLRAPKRARSGGVGGAARTPLWTNVRNQLGPRVCAGPLPPFPPPPLLFAIWRINLVRLGEPTTDGGCVCVWVQAPHTQKRGVLSGAKDPHPQDQFLEVYFFKGLPKGILKDSS